MNSAANVASPEHDRTAEEPAVEVNAAAMGYSAKVSYNSFFGFDETPFSIAPNPRFIFMSEQHQEALAHLLYGVSNSNGFVLLTGEVGTGKTTVIRVFLQHLPHDARVAYVMHAKLSARELLETVADELNVDYEPQASQKALISTVHSKLMENFSAGFRTFLLIDEAQNLTPDVLEEIRLLTNLETDEGKLLHIILVGQPELRDMFETHELRQLNQRITARYHLNQLSTDDVALYIQHRLVIAKAPRNPFKPKAFKAIARYSKGVPRLINVLCDRALLGAFARNQPEIDVDLVRQSAKEVFGRRRWHSKPGRRGWLGLMALMLCLTGVVTGLMFANAGQLIAEFWQGGEPEQSETLAETPVADEPGLSSPASDPESVPAGRDESSELRLPKAQNTESDSVVIKDQSAATDQTVTDDQVQSAETQPWAEGPLDPQVLANVAAQQAVNIESKVSDGQAPAIFKNPENHESNANAATVGQTVNQPVAVKEPESSLPSSSASPSEPPAGTDQQAAGSEPLVMTKTMSFSQGLANLLQLYQPSVAPATFAAVVNAGCDALPSALGCLKVSLDLQSMIDLNIPFLFTLAPAQLRSLGIEFDPESQSTGTWMLASGLNNDQLQVQGDNLTLEIPVDQLNDVFMGDSYLLLQTPVEELAPKQLLNESHALWVIQRIGFADGTQVDPEFDIFVSPATYIAAVKAFQSRLGLLPDGLFGLQTLIAVNRELDPGLPQL